MTFIIISLPIRHDVFKITAIFHSTRICRQMKPGFSRSHFHPAYLFSMKGKLVCFKISFYFINISINRFENKLKVAVLHTRQYQLSGSSRTAMQISSCRNNFSNIIGDSFQLSNKSVDYPSHMALPILHIYWLMHILKIKPISYKFRNLL